MNNIAFGRLHIPANAENRAVLSGIIGNSDKSELIADNAKTAFVEISHKSGSNDVYLETRSNKSMGFNELLITDKDGDILSHAAIPDCSEIKAKQLIMPDVEEEKIKQANYIEIIKGLKHLNNCFKPMYSPKISLKEGMNSNGEKNAYVERIFDMFV